MKLSRFNIGKIMAFIGVFMMFISDAKNLSLKFYLLFFGGAVLWLLGIAIMRYDLDREK